jgi:proteasome alpha subunit
MRAWAVGSLAQRAEETADGNEESKKGKGKGTAAHAPEAAALLVHLRETMAERTIECAVLDRNIPGSSKHRTLKADEVARLLPSWLQQS